MLDTLRSILGPPQEDVRAPDASYQPIGDDEEDGSVGATASRPTRVDEDKGVYWAFWALGAGVLLSWNVLICTIPLLMSFFAPNSSARATLPSTVSTVYCFGNLFFLGLAQRTVGKKSPSPRLHSSLLLLLGTSLILTFPLLPLVFPALSPSSALLLPLLVLTTLLLSVSTAYLQSSVFALSALWGSRQVLAVMSGQGGIAVLVSGVQILLAIVSSSSSSTESEPDASPADRQSTLAGVGLWALASVGSFVCMLSHRYLTRHQDYASVLSPIQHRQELEGDSTSSTKSSWAVSKRIFKKNLSLNIGVFMVFVVTLSVFPPITTSITSTHVPTPRLLQPAVFIPLHFFLFNVGDYAGRTYLPSMPMFMPKTQSRVLLLSLARVVFIPLFLMCNITPRTSASSPTINSDVAYFVIMILFGLTNGWISSLCMILASAPALNPAITEEEKDVAGTLAAFCLVAGLAGGSIASFVVMTLFRAFYVK